MSVLRVGTRGSQLALAQVTLVSQALEAHDIKVDVVTVQTAGDQRAPDTAWGEGAFVSAIELALLDGRVDVAVHSAKDVPTDEDPRLTIAAFLPRAEPRDALVLPAGKSGSLDELAPGSVVGTDSPRRTGFLRAHRHDLEVRPIHGNVDTRLRRLDEGAADALVLAAAGLIRLGRQDRISQLLPVDLVPPAPGQGAIAIQVRADDAQTRALVAQVDDMSTRSAVEAERAFLRSTGGGCRAPIGALATIAEGQVQLVGGFASLDGRATGLETISGEITEAEALAIALAQRVVQRRARLPGAPRILLTRSDRDSAQLAARLAEHGLASVVVPAIDVELLDTGDDFDEALRTLDTFDWTIVTSANGARAAWSAANRLGVDLASGRWAAVGQATARELIRHGAREVWLPTRANSASLARELPVSADAAIVWLRGDLADGDLTAALGERGGTVREVIVYRTVVGPSSSTARLEEALTDGPIDAVVLASPSAARGLLSLAGAGGRKSVLAMPAICIGDRTAEAARELGFSVAAVADSPEAGVIAEHAAELVRTSAPEPAGVAR